MSDTIDYIVTARKGVDVSSFDKDGKRCPRHAECGSTLKLTKEQAVSQRFINLVKPADADAKAKKAEAERVSKAEKRSEAARKGAETKAKEKAKADEAAALARVTPKAND